ncbi:Uncharacterised protein [Cedecea lapagei]|uniref:Uncharacterized protein n=1 Tax=Cedecea lapagei TaxID=158823 RepID=A0A447V601_9ENTR|nr:Uncharacterised protein [Cedecea lapagei]
MIYILQGLITTGNIIFWGEVITHYTMVKGALRAKVCTSDKGISA